MKTFGDIPTRGTLATCWRPIGDLFAGARSEDACMQRTRFPSALVYMVVCVLIVTLLPMLPAHSVQGTWKRQDSGIGSGLRSVTLFDQNRGLAVGDSGAILSTIDGGKTWARQYACTGGGACSATSNGQITATLNGITSLGNGAAYVVGQSVGSTATILKQSGPTAPWTPQFVCVMTDDCEADSQDQLDMSGGGLRAVHFYSSAKGAAVGTDGTIAVTDNGSHWQARPSGTLQHLNDVWFASAAVGWAVGNDGTILTTTTGGMTWVPQYACSSSTSCTPAKRLEKNLNAVTFVSPTEGYIVGDDGTILYTRDAGETWTLQASDSTQHLYDVQTSGSSVISAGTAGTFLTTTNAGAAWTPMYACVASEPCTASSTDRLFYPIQSVAMRSPSIGTAVGGAGTIVRLGSTAIPSPTPTGGPRWTVQATDVVANLRATSFVNSSTGYAVGSEGTILRTSDGGASWERVLACASGQPTGAGCEPGSADRITVALNGVVALDRTNAIAVGNDGHILKTSNGGTTWTRVVACRITARECDEGSDPDERVASPLEAIHGFNASMTAVGADGTILFSRNGGATWSQRPNITDVGLRSVWFTDTDTGYIVGEEGTILKTTNEGQTWQPQLACADNDQCLPQLEGHIDARLNSVMFTNADDGIIVGEQGTVVTTTDAGEHWTQQSSGTSQGLNGVFVNGGAGYAVGASGTIITTPNAGISWAASLACRSTDPCSAAAPDRISHSLNAVFMPGSNLAHAVGQAGMAIVWAPQLQATPTPTPTVTVSPTPTVSPSAADCPQPTSSPSASSPPSPSASPSPSATESTTPCPTPTPTVSASPSPTSSYLAFITVRYNEKKKTFKGLIASDHESCWQNRGIKVKKVRKGKKDATIGLGLSNTNGKWSLRLSKKSLSGRFYAVGPKHASDQAVCKKARSSTIKLRRDKGRGGR